VIADLFGVRAATGGWRQRR